MKKVKGKEKKNRVVAEKYEKDGESSDDEVPEVVSNAAMKSNHELINKELKHVKQQLRQVEKAKRRQKQEMFIAQKKTKESHHEESVTDELTKESEENPAGAESETQTTRQIRPLKKVYSSLKITVEPLTKIHDTRASAALEFKSRRLAKVPRESVKTSVISYQKKLQTRK